MKYTVDATLTICLTDVRVNIDPDAASKDDLDDELQDAVMQVVQKRLTLLDIKGGRTGDDGVIEHMECDSVDNWVSN